MRAYGNMSAAEKAMNKDDLMAYKHNINKNYALIPGIQTTVEINDKQSHSRNDFDEKKIREKL